MKLLAIAPPGGLPGLVSWGCEFFDQLANWFIFSDEYVICNGCKSSDTILSKENRLFFLRCEQVYLIIESYVAFLGVWSWLNIHCGGAGTGGGVVTSIIIRILCSYMNIFKLFLWLRLSHVIVYSTYISAWYHAGPCQYFSIIFFYCE